MTNKDVTAPLQKIFRRLTGTTITLTIVLVLVQAAAIYAVGTMVLNAPTTAVFTILGIASVTLFLTGLIINSQISSTANKVRQQTNAAFQQELGTLRAAAERADALKEMASVLRATLSFERVVDAAIEMCIMTLEEPNVPRNSLVGAVLLYEGQYLVPVTARRLLPVDESRRVPGKEGALGEALDRAESVVAADVKTDPELTEFATFRNATTAVCIPLRAGFQIFGAMVIAANVPLTIQKEDLSLFDAVADQAVIALQNAQLYQRLEAEKERLIAADEVARKELARDLHDGPTQTIAAIAMRVNFIRSLISRDPEQAMGELKKVEELAKRTSKEVRGMLFTLRPLVLETQGLTAAINNVINRIKDTDNLNIKLVGGDNGDLLNENAQGVVFAIVEEALGNARKYSKAELVEVRFWKEENLFVAQVRDNGVGFDVAEVNRDYSSRGSLGMLNMQERAERINGSVKLDSAIGQGTTVTLVVPLDKHGRR